MLFRVRAYASCNRPTCLRELLWNCTLQRDPETRDVVRRVDEVGQEEVGAGYAQRGVRPVFAA